MTTTTTAQGEYFMSGSQDKTIKLWNAHEGNLIQTYAGHGKEVASVAVQEDLSFFVVGLRLVH